MAIYALPTGVIHRTSAFAYRGGSPWEKWDSVMTAVLVRHPKGDVLIDTGVGRTVASQLKEAPLLFRLVTDLVPLQPAADQLDAAGYDRKKLAFHPSHPRALGPRKWCIGLSWRAGSGNRGRAPVHLRGRLDHRDRPRHGQLAVAGVCV